MKQRIQKIKQHFKDQKKFYLGIGVGACAIGTVVYMRERSFNGPISRDVIVTAGRDAIVSRKKVVLENVSFFSADRQGPPSWVIRCKETGDIFTSQNSAAIEMGIDKSNISRQLNGLQENAQGYHFERICMAA